MVRSRLALAVVTGLILSVSAVAPSAFAGSAGPPGNNGFVEIDVADVGCVFQLDFYGFAEGDLFAEVTFEVVPPTGSAAVLTDTVFIGEDAAGGGTDLDAAKTYTLDFSGFQPHPRQGFHVKLTVHAPGSQGADTKHKLFWVEAAPGPPCFFPLPP